MIKKINILLCAFIVTMAFSFNQVDGYDVIENKIVIKLDSEIAPKLGFEKPFELRELLALSSEFKSLDILEFRPLFINNDNFGNLEYKHFLHLYYVLRFDNEIDFYDIKNRLELIEGIDLVEPVFIKEAYFTPNDPYYSDQWAHDNYGQANSASGGSVGTPDCDTDTDLAWDITTGDPSIIIAILDTGVNEHSELQGRLVPGYDYVYQDDNPSDIQGHGTACAGIAAAKGNNNSGIAGGCWDCSVMPVKVLGDDGYGEDTVIAAAIQETAAAGVQIISMSLGGGGYNSYLDNSVSYAVDAGTVVFAASGNDNNGTISYPAHYDDCIAVGAMSPCNERKNTGSCDGENYWGSNYGSDLDFVTPGVRINTITSSGGYTSTFNGTSSACPHAAGIAGLILSVAPNMTPEQVRTIMQMNADDIGSPGFDNETGYGRVNAYQSVLNLLNSPEIFIDVAGFDVELSSGGNTSEEFVIVNTGEAELLFSIDQESYQSINSDNNDLSYEWIDITSDYQTLNMLHNDYASEQSIDLNFNFPFYENSFSSFIVNSNGWLGFGADNTGWDNLSLPNSQAPLNAIFGFWDDLNPVNDSNSSGNGLIKYSSMSDKAVVWFDSVDHWPTNFEGSNYDFQMVLYSSGDIRFNYRSMLGDASSATIGVQNSDGSLGTQLSYNSIFAHDELSALIYRFPSWLDLEISESSLAPGGSLVLELLFDANNLEEGVYEYQMVLETNDFQQPYVYVPITLTVNGDACGDWVIGDLNQDNIYNVLDVILTVNLVLSDTGIPECELYSADLNQDGILNILDVLLVINLVLDN
tara:strand:+ start:101 stop:2524 length:2424 start_codon:yes stop_codon:yes gene_type:complete